MPRALPLALPRPIVGDAWPLPAAFLCLLGLSLAPMSIVDIPAMVDYPNHLARMSVLARDGTATASPFYEVAWRPYPNLAMDLLVPPVARMLGVEAATKAFLLLGQVLLVGGAVAIEWAVKRRFAAAGFAALLYLYAWPFAFGFANFAFALGIALWGIAAWIRFADRSLALRAAIHAGFVLVLYVGHMFALGLYGLTIGLIELHNAAERRTWNARFLALVVLMAAPVLALTLVLLGFGGSVGGSGTDWAFQGKALFLFAINGYAIPVSILTTTGLGLGAYVAARRGWLRFVGPGAWIAGGLALAFVALPFRLFDTAYVDVRVATAAAFILPAFLVWNVPDRRARRALVILVAGVAALNLAVVASVQSFYAAEYRRVIDSFRHLGPNARILVAPSGQGLDPPSDLSEYPILHAPVLAVHYADAFVSTLFAYPGKQPVVPRPESRRLADTGGGMESIERLARLALGETVPGTPPYVANWTRDFDHLYVVGPIVANPLPGRLIPLAQGERFTAYRIVR